MTKAEYSIGDVVANFYGSASQLSSMLLLWKERLAEVQTPLADFRFKNYTLSAFMCMVSRLPLIAGFLY